MTKELPLVSVIVPAYNAETFIQRTLDSILAQTYTNIEVLVVDDGSQDRTAAIIESFVEKNSRVILLRQKNAGVAAARNLAIEKSRGQYIAPIDADDIWYPQKLERQVQCILEADQSVGFVYAWSVRIDEDDRIIQTIDIEDYSFFKSVEGAIYPALVYTNFIGNGSSLLIRRACFEKLGGYDCKLKAHNAQGCEDWDICLRISEHYKVRVVREILIGYRQVRESMSRNYKSMERSYNIIMANLQPRHPEIPRFIYNLSTSNFCLYLLDKSQKCGDYWSACMLVYKSIKLDYYQAFNLCVNLSIIKLLLKIIGKPIMLFFGLEHDHWYQYLKKKYSFSNNLAVYHGGKFLDINQRVSKQRWLKVLQYCQTFELLVK